MEKAGSKHEYLENQISGANKRMDRIEKRVIKLEKRKPFERKRRVQ